MRRDTAVTADRSGAVDAARELYADCFVNAPCGVFTRLGDTIQLLPPQMPSAKGVYVLQAGVAFAQVMQGRTMRLEPTHALFQSAKVTDCRRLLDLAHDDPRASAFLRGEEIAVSLPDGWTAVAVNGMTTGFGKVAGGRLKNRYPKGLRLIHG